MANTTYNEIGSTISDRYTELRSTTSNAEAMDSVMREFSIENKRSLTSFLSSAKGGKVYLADAKASVGGGSSVRKAHLVKSIAEKLGIDYAEIESLEKANKGALEALLKESKIATL